MDFISLSTGADKLRYDNTLSIYLFTIVLKNLSQTEEPAMASTCARDRRVLQQLALNVYVKHSDLT